jgi:hypothetical protein
VSSRPPQTSSGKGTVDDQTIAITTSHLPTLHYPSSTATMVVYYEIFGQKVGSHIVSGITNDPSISWSMSLENKSKTATFMVRYCIYRG